MMKSLGSLRYAAAYGLLLLLAAGPARAERPTPAPLDREAAAAEAESAYAAAHPEVREYVLHTARSFGRSGLWLNEQAFAEASSAQRDAEAAYLATLLNDGEYGRHLCDGLARASALTDERLVPGLIRAAGFHQPDRDYDCRPKWMAVAALARQDLLNLEDPALTQQAVALLVHLTDHGNQNTRFWARAALARHLKQDLGGDKAAWNALWIEMGHDPLGEDALAPYAPPPAP